MLNQTTLLCLRFWIIKRNGAFVLNTQIQKSVWTHVVLNYIGTDDGEGVTMSINGREVASDADKYTFSHSAGDGRIVVGRWEKDTDLDNNYSGVHVDELIFFNQTLTQQEINILAAAT